ncbi:hypothetical protein Q7P35_005557 [Cladosporium inversicolor]
MKSQRVEGTPNAARSHTRSVKRRAKYYTPAGKARERAEAAGRPELREQRRDEANPWHRAQLQLAQQALALMETRRALATMRHLIRQASSHVLWHVCGAEVYQDRPTASVKDKVELGNPSEATACLNARTMDDVQGIRMLSEIPTRQHRHQNTELTFSTHATDHTGHHVGTDFPSSTPCAPQLAHPCLLQKSWPSVFLPSLGRGDIHTHETRPCSAGLARLEESKAFSGVALSSNWNGSHPNGSSLHATKISTSVSSRGNDKDYCTASTTNASEGSGKLAELRSNTSTTIKPAQRAPRPLRPLYSEEQRFFIMYHRVIKKESWDDIEKMFENFFDPRTKDALNSAYYRIRQEWGMKPVLSDDSKSDVLKVEQKAKMVPSDFLQRIGYRLSE